MEVKNNEPTSRLWRMRLWCRDSFLVPRSEIGQIALDGLWLQNPVLVLLLGLCPALAVTTSLQNGVGMGLATAAVLVCSNFTISLLRKVIPSEIRAISSLVIIAAFTTAADLLMQALLPNLSETLGLYVPLIAVNGLLLGRAETFARDHPPGKALLDGLCSGLGFTGALAILGAVREILGAGTVWGAPLPLISTHPLRLLLSPCGGFLVLGCLAALVQHARHRKGGCKAWS